MMTENLRKKIKNLWFRKVNLRIIVVLAYWRKWSIIYIFFFFWRLISVFYYYSFFFFNFFLKFLSVLGLRFCARAFCSCGKRGPLFIAVRGPLTIAASLVAEHRLQTRRLSSCGSRA